MRSKVLLTSIVPLLAACLAQPTEKVVVAYPLPPLDVPAAGEAPVLRRLTQAQYQQAGRDLFGQDWTQAVTLEPDTRSGGLYAVGAAEAATSRWGVEQYEAAAQAAAKWATAEPARRERLAPCAREKASLDRGCFETVATSVGRRAWRRPLTPAQVGRLAEVGVSSGALHGDPVAGLEYLLSAMLQSPYFLYRVELGEPDPRRPGFKRYTNDEMASRLSFLFANTIPDDQLSARAAQGELTDDEGLGRAVAAMLDRPAAHQAIRTLFSEILELDRIDAINKDPRQFRHARPELWASAKEETLRTIEALVFERGDYRDLFRSRVTFVDRRLAALYGVPAPGSDGFSRIELPAGGMRRGLLGQAAFLAPNAHPVSSSATLRGKYVREVLLCQSLPPPPANVDTSLPEPSTTSPTLRERVRVHLENPGCAACHRAMDPIGLGLENFDGIGRFRAAENGAPIDAGGELDGVPFTNPSELASAVSAHPDLGPCLVRTVFRYATGRFEGPGDGPLLGALEARFKSQGRQVAALLADLAVTQEFRQAGVEEAR